MRLEVAKAVFKTGGLKRALITEDPLGKGWMILLVTAEGDTIPLDTARGSARSFVGLQPCWNTVRSIGFNQASLQG